MRILHYILTMKGGGAERQLAFLASALGRRGHDVHVAFVQPGVNADRLTGSRCTLHRLVAFGKYDPLLPVRSVVLARRLRPDVVHTWLTHMDIVGGSTARLLRIPWLMSERSSALSYPSGLLNHLRVAVARHADLIVPNSGGGADYWKAQGVDGSRIEIVPNFVAPPERESEPPLNDPRIEESDELVLFVGRLSPEKNLRCLIDAMQHVVRVRPRAKLALCGEGPLLAELTDQASAADIAKHVIFAGYVQSVTPWLSRACVGVAVSRFEGHPNAALEAMAAGVPLVVSDIASYRSLLDDNAALFAQVDDVKGIASAITRTLEDRASALQRAQRARAALAVLSLDATAAHYETIYERLARGRR